MDNLTLLKTSELKQIEGGGPISDWVSCFVRGLINSANENPLVLEMENKEAFIDEWGLRD
jgi:hypothetical protein